MGQTRSLEGNGKDNASTPHKIKAGDLFGEKTEILIDHEGVEYRLRITSNDKLILTK